MIVRGEFGDHYFLPYAPKILMQSYKDDDKSLIRITDTGMFYVAFATVYKDDATDKHRYLICRVLYKNLVQGCAHTVRNIDKIQKPSADLAAYLLATGLTHCSSTNAHVFSHELARITAFMSVVEETQYLPTTDNAEWLPVHMHAAIGTVYGDVLQEIANVSGVKRAAVDQVFDALHEIIQGKLYQSNLLGLESFDFRIPYLCHIGMRTTAQGKKRLHASTRDMWNIHKFFERSKQQNAKTAEQSAKS